MAEDQAILSLGVDAPEDVKRVAFRGTLYPMADVAKARPKQMAVLVEFERCVERMQSHDISTFTDADAAELERLMDQVIGIILPTFPQEHMASISLLEVGQLVKVFMTREPLPTTSDGTPPSETTPAASSGSTTTSPATADGAFGLTPPAGS